MHGGRAEATDRALQVPLAMGRDVVAFGHGEVGGDLDVGLGVQRVADPAHPDAADVFDAVDAAQDLLGLVDERRGRRRPSVGGRCRGPRPTGRRRSRR